MKLVGILGVLCFAAAPVAGSQIAYNFATTSGNLDIIDTTSLLSVSSSLSGGFVLTIDQSDAHIGISDVLTLGTPTEVPRGMSLLNDAPMVLGPILSGAITAHIPAGGVAFLDFKNAAPIHIDGPILNPLSDIYIELSAPVTGAAVDTFTTSITMTPGPIVVNIQTSVMESDIMTASLSFTQPWVIVVTDPISVVLTLDLVVTAEGTAHVAPDPALGGLTALGLGGAGAWLRRRRS